MRIFIGIYVVLYFVFISCDNKHSEASSTLPNIVWLVAEDQSPEHFPMYGNKFVSLPNIEQLTKDGVLYTNAYAPVPVCAPSRSALITGMYPSTMGTHNMRTYNGYKDFNEPSINIPSYSPVVPEGVKMFTEYLRTAGYYCTNNPKEDYNFKPLPSAWDESSKEAHWRNRPKGAPFFAVFNFQITHESQIWRQADQPLLVDPNSLTVPPIFPDNSIIRKDLAVNYSNLMRLDQQIGVIIDKLKATGQYDNTLIFFYGDHGAPFPRHKRALYETGIRVPLVVKMPQNTNAGSQESRLVSFIDYAPSILSFVGIEPPKIMQGKAFLGKYKTEAPSFVFTTSDRYDEKVDRLRAVRYGNYKYIRNFNVEISNALPVAYREQMAMMQNMREQWEAKTLPEAAARWFATPKSEEELYDITVDPYELNNLAANPTLKDTLSMLRNKLEQWMKETGDLGALPEKEILKQFFPDGNPPKLFPPSYQIVDNRIVLKHQNAGSTIIWQKEGDSVWSIYDQPLTKTSPIKVKAVRIGYNTSEILELD